MGWLWMTIRRRCEEVEMRLKDWGDSRDRWWLRGHWSRGNSRSHCCSRLYLVYKPHDAYLRVPKKEE